MPHSVGGANTELWHTIKLFTKFGIHCTCIIQKDTISKFWEEKIKLVGCEVARINLNDQNDYALFSDRVVINFCKDDFSSYARRLKFFGSKIIWVNCMNFLFDYELHYFLKFGLPNYFVFQSQFQSNRICTELRDNGFDKVNYSVIRGAFDIEEFHYAPLPHQKESKFKIGKLARPALDKWPDDLWTIFSLIPYRNVEAQVMGWNSAIRNKCGWPPSWVKTYLTDEISVQSFLGGLHCLLTKNGGAIENWPRVGLEALACGVPLIAEKKGGWQEMIEHEVNGFICASNEEMAYYSARLAYDEVYRLRIASQGREFLQGITNEELFVLNWLEVIKKFS